MDRVIKTETIENWKKRTGKTPKVMACGKPQPLGTRFKWKDVGKGPKET